MTCYNRKDKTLACLGSLFGSHPPCELEVYLLDDASTDGTSRAVRERFPQVHLISGAGNAYWAGGTRLAWEAAKDSGVDAFVLLNDDVHIDPDAFTRLVHWFERLGDGSVLGCAVRSSDGGQVTYGGMRRNGVHPMKFELVQPAEDGPSEADVLNGNLMLIPDKVYRTVGMLPRYLVHIGGDFDYTLRARKAGFKALLLPGTFGSCDKNPPAPHLRGFKALRMALSPKCWPPSSTIPLYRAHAGFFWPVWWVMPYVRAFLFGF